MIMADVFMWLFLILGLLVVLVSYWLLFEAAFTSVVDRARKRVLDRPIRTFFLGLLFAGPGVPLGLAMMNGGAALIGVVMLSVLVLLGLMGSTGIARHIGERLNSPRDESQPWLRVLRGGSVLVMCMVLPVVGWFVVAPAVLVTGVGASVKALWRRKERASALPPAPAEGDVEAAGA